MGRLTGRSVKEVQANRLEIAQEFAARNGVVLVLKGDRTIIAFPDGETWINPTGSPSMATGGTGDILTGMIAGLLAQHPDDPKRAIIGAVWLTGAAANWPARVWASNRSRPGPSDRTPRRHGATPPTPQKRGQTDFKLDPISKLLWAIETASDEETRAAGRHISTLLPVQGVVLLSGDLGAGKTTITKGMVPAGASPTLRRFRARPTL